jgi:hypothetical protein
MAGYGRGGLEDFRKWCDNYINLALGLILVNAAGVAYYIKVAMSISSRYRFGDFLLLFVLGAMFGGLFFMAMRFARGDFRTARGDLHTGVVTQLRPGRTVRETAVEWSGYVGLWGSAICFAGALLLFVLRFQGL